MVRWDIIDSNRVMLTLPNPCAPRRPRIRVDHIFRNAVKRAGGQNSNNSGDDHAGCDTILLGYLHLTLRA